MDIFWSTFDFFRSTFFGDFTYKICQERTENAEVAITKLLTFGSPQFALKIFDKSKTKDKMKYIEDRFFVYLINLFHQMREKKVGLRCLSLKILIGSVSIENLT